VLLELTEVLSCPACGPEHGFVAFVDRLEKGSILQGRLDCPQCERRHRVVDGVLYITEERSGEAEALELPAAAELASALLGVPPGPEVLLLGPGLDGLAAGLAGERPAASLLCLTAVPAAPADRVHPIVADETRTLPFRSARIHGAVLRGGTAVGPAEIVRVLAPGARIVILEPGPELLGFEAFGTVSAVASDSRAAVLVASPLSAV